MATPEDNSPEAMEADVERISRQLAYESVKYADAYRDEVSQAIAGALSNAIVTEEGSLEFETDFLKRFLAKAFMSGANMAIATLVTDLYSDRRV